jgi:hypothetical protein
MVAALFAASALAQQVYKSVDAQGNVVYSDRGSTKNAPTTSVHVTEPDPAEVARLAKQQQLLSAAERQRQKEALDSKNKAAADQHRQAARDAAILPVNTHLLHQLLRGQSSITVTKKPIRCAAVRRAMVSGGS